MQTEKKIIAGLDYMAELFPDPQIELSYSTPFQLLLSVILSAQTTDIQVNKVTSHFYETILSPSDLIENYTSDQREAAIAWVNYYKTKAKNTYTLAHRLIDEAKETKTIKSTISTLPLEQRTLAEKLQEEYKYYIPATLPELMTYPWVWEKTAKVVLHVLYKLPFIAVDTHVHRIANRLWRVETKTPLETSHLIEWVVPDRYNDIAHHTIILFGRYHCKAKKPACESCKLTSICKHYAKISKE